MLELLLIMSPFAIVCVAILAHLDYEVVVVGGKLATLELVVVHAVELL
jgi:hypothetical protein